MDLTPLLDPATYASGPPFALLARLRERAPVAWVDEPDGPGFWLVLRHAEVEHVLRNPADFSSWLGATQVRQDPDYATSAAFDVEGGTAIARAAVALRPAPPLPDPRTRAGMPDLYAYAGMLAEEKRRAPGSDVMSILLAQPDTVSTDEFENMFWLFAVAGNETVRNGLPGGLIALLEHPSALAELRRDRSLLPGAVEEMLRWWTPVMVFRRTATRDLDLAGTAVRGGDKVVVSFTSANRDDRVFADPDAFTIARDPNPHLTFGHGPHFCLGAHLARLQMRALFGELLRRTRVVETAGEPALLHSTFQRGVKRLPIRWAR